MLQSNMNRFFKTILTIVVATNFAGQAFAQSYKYYSERVAKIEKRAQEKYQEFRFVKSVETFPKRINATDTVDIVTTPRRTIVALHDRITGKPIESCMTPCTLHREPGVAYGIHFYKQWYWPKHSGINAGTFGDIRPIKMQMGMNYYDVKKKQKKCLKDFNNSEKVDGDAKSCYRFPPLMPRKAKKSGHCIVTMDIDPKGKPFNIQTESCTDEIFARPSKSSVYWWRFTPKVERGEAVTQYGAENKITYKLKSRDGNIVPEH